VNSLRCDVLIIGSGAAGGVLAATLSELTGKRIVVVEKGGYFAREYFNQREWDMRTLYADSGRRSTVDGAIPVRGGQCVGGGTTVNYALCFDPVEKIWARWKTEHSLKGFSFDAGASDYGVPGLNLATSLQQVRTRIGVHPATDEDVNENNRIFERGCRALGISARRFELNMRDCLRCGYCAEGCAYDRKQGTMITYLADAMARGVRLVHHCEIERLQFERRGGELRVTGARGRVRPTRRGSRPNSVSPGRIEIEAPLVILAAGAIETPALLQRSNHPDPQRRIGKGLVLHPSLPVAGIMDEPIENARGISGSVYSDHFAASHGFYFECLFGHPVYGSLVLPGIGPEHFALMRALPRIAAFGIMLVDGVDDANRVEWRSEEGAARIHYQLLEADRQRLRFAAEKAVELMFAAGAREVVLSTDEPIGPRGAARFRSPAEARYCSELAFRPGRTVVTSAHCQGTAKMGEDPARSVVNSRCESHQVHNLLVCDSSSFVESCGVNPMLSIMSLARYQGRRIAAELGRYGL